MDEGGWGGERGPVDKSNSLTGTQTASLNMKPETIKLFCIGSMETVTLFTLTHLCSSGGFPKPILHGLCTYGFTGRALVHLACDGNPDNFKSMDGRFSSPVIPGETLEVHVWEDGDI